MDKSINVTTLQEECYEISAELGFHNDPVPFSEVISNLHSEVSEAWEWWRHGNPSSNHIPEFSGIEEELADVVIRILDTCEENGYRLVDAIKAKMRFNKTRPYRNGGKLA